MESTPPPPPRPTPPDEEYFEEGFKDRLMPWLIGVTVLVLIGVAVVFGGRPALRHYKVRKALVKVEETEPMLASGDLAGAAPNVRLVLALAPMEPRVWRLAARYCVLTGSPDGIDYWERLSTEPGFSDPERLEFVTYALRMGRHDLAERQVKELLRQPAPGTDAWRLAVRTSRERGDRRLLLDRSRGWLREAPESEEVQWTLGDVLVDFTEAEAQAEGKSMLWSMAFGKGPYATPALVSLMKVRELGRGELDALRRAAEERLLSPALVARLQVRLDPEQPEPAIRRLVEACVGTTNLLHRREAVVYLADTGRVKEALELLPKGLARGDSRLHMARLQALLEVGRLEEAKVELGELTEEDDLEAHLRRCLEAQVAVKEDQNARAATLLREAIRACRGLPVPLQFVAIYSEQLGFPRVALEAHEKLAEWPPMATESTRQLLRLAMRLDEPIAARDALRRGVRARLDDESLRVGLAYLEALTDARRAADHLADVRTILGKQPADEFTRATLALIQWRLGDLPGALGTMEEGGVDWERAPARCRAIQAALLGANLQREPARRIAREIGSEPMLTLEKQLFHEWR